MIFAPDLATVTHGIQLAVAPVFLLTAVSGMIGAVAGRLARIIDRARFLENRLETGSVEKTRAAKMYGELRRLRHRGWLVNGCLALLTFCAILIGSTIIFAVSGRDQRASDPANRHRVLSLRRRLLSIGAGVFPG